MYDDRHLYCVTAFMDSIYVIGSRTHDYCLSFNTTNQSWRKISETLEPGFNKACAVFQGRVIVSGGFVINNDGNDALRNVEAYDQSDDSWSKMATLN